MADKSWNNKNKKDRDLDRLFNDLTQTEREDLKRVWDHSRDVQFDEPDIPDSETEDALLNVNRKLGFEPEDNEEKLNSNSYFLKYLAVAAVFFIAAIIGYLSTEKKYIVPNGEIFAFTLSDGTDVELNSGSEISHNRLYGITNRDLRLNGEAYFEVQNNDNPFVVYANNTIIEVTGTKFNVRSWADDPGSRTTVSVTSGSVQFYPEQSPDHKVRLIEGNFSEWRRNMLRPEDPVRISVENVIAWRNHNLAFINEPLYVIFRELERKYDIIISADDQEIQNSVLTTFYSDPENVESILADITTVKGLTYSKTANGYRISRQ
jgi:transmembrane sensor